MPKTKDRSAADGAHLRFVQGAAERLKQLRHEADLAPEQQALLEEALADLVAMPAWKHAPAQAEFEAWAENAPDLIARFDRNLRYLYVNAAVARATGLPAHAFVGKSTGELDVPRAISSLWESQVSKVLRTGQAGQFQFSADGPDGQRYYDARLAPVLVSEGTVESVLSIVRDVTDFEQTRRTLRRYAKRLHFLHEVEQATRAANSAEEVAEAALPFAQQLLPSLRASVALYDLEQGEAVLIAVQADQETSLAKGKHLSLEWAWFLDELASGNICTIEDLSSLESPAGVLDTFLAEGVHSLVSVPLIVHDRLIGSLNLGLAAPGELSAEQKEVAHEIANHLALAIHQARLHEEIQRHAENLELSVVKRTAALRSSEARFRAVFEDAAIGIALVDMAGRIATSNPALQEMLGYTAEELRGLSVSRFIHPEDVGRRDALFQELIAGERNHFTMEKRYIRKDGTTIWVQPTVSVIRNLQNGGRYAIKMVEDITEQRQAREALIQAERLTAVGQLGASLAHEISNPLQSVIGSLGLAAEMLEPGDEAAVFLEMAIEELERTADIVAQLRDLSRKSDPGEKAPAQLNEIVERVLVLNRKLAEKHHVEVDWRPAGGLPPVSMVPGRIRQVLLNLVLNALQAMPEGGHLEISTQLTTEPDGVRVRVADTGPGIEPSILPHLFEPFHSTRPEGLGLGLHISKTIVEQHGGCIEVDSPVGQGATFTIWLPQQHEDSQEGR